MPHRHAPRPRLAPARGLAALAVLVLALAPAAARPAPVPAAAAPASASVAVTILHTTDVHGHLRAWDYDTGHPVDGYGLARVATLVRRVRAEPGIHALLVDAGDCIAGSALSDRHDAAVAAARGDALAGLAPDPQVACYNALGYDAMTVGNHEYNFGLGVLERARNAAHYPWLSANTRKVAPDGKDAYQPYLVKEVDGVRIGILGLTTPGIPTWEDSAHYAGLAFDDPLETARHYVPILRDQERCDAVIVLCHMGLEEDDRGNATPGQAPNENRVLAIARGVPGIDAVIMGHTHVKIASKTEHGVLLTQAGKWGEALGRLDLTFEKNATGPGYKLTDKKAALLTVDASVPEDPEIVALAAPDHDATERGLTRVVGTAARNLSSSDARVRDNAVVDLVQRTQLDFAHADVSFAAAFSTRVTIPAGPITVRDVQALYPYPNTLVAVLATGQDVKDALEHAATYFNTYDFGRSRLPSVNPQIQGYNFDIAQGVSYTLDATRPPGQRIVGLTWHGKSLAPTQRLRVALNNYRANGGGGFDMWKDKQVVWRTDRQVRDLVMDELGKIGTVKGTLDGHWQAVPAWALGSDPASPAREALELLVRQGVVQPDSALAWGLDAPLTRHRYGAWLAALGDSTARALVDPSAPGWGRTGTGGAANASPAGPVNFDLARVCARYALPEPVRSRFMGMQAGAWDAVGPGLSVADGAAVLTSVFFPRLTILETTDFHGALLPGAKDRATGRPVGGAGAVAGLIEKERAKNPHATLLLDGGDWMQGTPISNLNFGRPVIQLMNRIGVDVSAIGNHEFDWTADTLFARMGEAHFQPVAANWYDKATHRRAAGIAPWTMVERDGMNIGVIGLLTTETPTTTKPDNVTRYEFPPGGPVARALEDSLRAAGADLIVVVGHLPANVDSTGTVRGELAEVAHAVAAPGGATRPGSVIAVFGGHSHNRVSGVVDGTPVMISGALGNTLGRMDFVIDRRTHTPVARETRRQLLTPFGDDPAALDNALTAYADSVNKDLAPIMDRVVGHAPTQLTRNRLGESALGDWVADAMRDAVGADIAFQNPGGLRAELDAGEVTVGDIYAVMPFDNTVETVTLTGAQVLDVLEHGVSPTTCVQLSGLRLTYDPARPRGERVVEALLPNHKRIDMAARYKVATNDFMAQGGDGFTTFAQGTDLTNRGVLVRDAMQRWVEKLTAQGNVLEPPPPGRIVNLGGAKGPVSETARTSN